MEFTIPYTFKKIYSTKNQSQQINNIILTYIDKNSIVTDATSCIGGNSYFFCRDFKFVNCIEKDRETFKILEENLIGLNNKVCYNCSYNIIKHCIRQNVIFIDPPWGGNIYKKFKNIELYLDGLNIITIIDSLYNDTNLVCLKVPNNFDFNFKSNFWDYKIHNILNKTKIIYKIIIFLKPV